MITFKKILPLLVFLASIFQVVAAATISIDAFTADTYNGLLTLIQPAGFIFSIWGLIYLLSFVYGIYQLFPKNNNEFLEHTRPYVLFAFIGSGVWLWCAGLSLDWVWLTVPVLVAIACLFFETITSPHAHKLSGWQKFFSYTTLLPYAAWTAIAQVVNLHSILNQYGVIPNNDVNLVVAIVLLLVIAGITLRSLRYTKYNPWYGVVIVWATSGIAYANYTQDQGSQVIMGLSLLVAIIATIIMIVKRHE